MTFSSHFLKKKNLLFALARRANLFQLFLAAIDAAVVFLFNLNPELFSFRGDIGGFDAESNVLGVTLNDGGLDG